VRLRGSVEAFTIGDATPEKIGPGTRGRKPKRSGRSRFSRSRVTCDPPGDLLDPSASRDIAQDARVVDEPDEVRRERGEVLARHSLLSRRAARTRKALAVESGQFRSCARRSVPRETPRQVAVGEAALGGRASRDAEPACGGVREERPPGRYVRRGREARLPARLAEEWGGVDAYARLQAAAVARGSLASPSVAKTPREAFGVGLPRRPR